MGKLRALLFICVLIASLTIAAPAGAAERRCLGEKATIVGTSGDDTLRGTDERDVILGLGGQDEIRSGGGDDIVCAGRANDFVAAGGGNDSVSGGSGSDTIELGEGVFCIPCPLNPQIGYGNSGDDEISTDNAGELVGGSGDDLLVGSSDGGGAFADFINYDQFVGGAGNDDIDGRGGKDLVEFDDAPQGVRIDLAGGTARGEGRDRIESVSDVDGSPFDDVVVGDASRNAFYLGRGNDEAELGGGNDYFDGGSGDDTGDGGDGDDEFTGGGGADDVDGGTGTDLVYLNSQDVGVTVDLSAGTSVGSESEVVANFENVQTTRRADNVVGTEGSNEIFTFGGDDTIDAGAGDDAISAGGGDNQIDGGEGVDLVSYDEEVDADLQTGVATHVSFSDVTSTDSLVLVESLHGSFYEDILRGNDVPNVLHGLEGDDEIDGRGGDDELRGGRVLSGSGCGPTDVIVVYPDGADTIRGGDGNDLIYGGSVIEGNPCPSHLEDVGDSLFGDEGDDTLEGGEGDDDLDGGAGTDSLRGGPDEDQCVEGETVTSCEGP